MPRQKTLGTPGNNAKIPHVLVNLGHRHMYTSYFGGNIKSKKIFTNPYTQSYLNKMKPYTTPTQYSNFYIHYICSCGNKNYLKVQTDENGVQPSVTTNINEASSFTIDSTSFPGHKLIVTNVNGTEVFLRTFSNILIAQLHDTHETGFITDGTQTAEYINNNLGNIMSSTFTYDEYMFTYSLDNTSRTFYASVK